MNLQENISRIREVMGLLNEQSKPQVIWGPTGFTSTYETKKYEVNWDDVVDVISAIADGIPGIGNLMSVGLDIGHVVSYLIRFGLSDDESEKIEYMTMSLITAAMAFVPVAGNSANILIRQGVKSLLKKTPDDLTRWAIRNGIINPRILFGKGKFKYNLILLLVRIFKDEAAEIVAKLAKFFNDLRKGLSKSNIPGIEIILTPLTKIIEILNDINNPQLFKIANEFVKKSPNFDFE